MKMVLSSGLCRCLLQHYGLPRALRRNFLTTSPPKLTLWPQRIRLFPSTSPQTTFFRTVSDDEAPRCPYEVLGLSRMRHITQQDIRQAYLAKVLEYHPDSNPGDRIAEDMFIEVRWAYEQLRDPELKKRDENKERVYNQFNTDLRKTDWKPPPLERDARPPLNPPDPKLLIRLGFFSVILYVVGMFVFANPFNIEAFNQLKSKKKKGDSEAGVVKTEDTGLLHGLLDSLNPLKNIDFFYLLKSKKKGRDDDGDGQE